MWRDTRKTIPGWRLLDKYARRKNGRWYEPSLSVCSIWHLTMGQSPRDAAGSLTAAIRRCNESLKDTPANTYQKPKLVIWTMFVKCLLAWMKACAMGVLCSIILRRGEFVMLVRLVGGRTATEASGGIHARIFALFAEAGVDIISVGALYSFGSGTGYFNEISITAALLRGLEQKCNPGQSSQQIKIKLQSSRLGRGWKVNDFDFINRAAKCPGWWSAISANTPTALTKNQARKRKVVNLNSRSMAFPFCDHALCCASNSLTASALVF